MYRFSRHDFSDSTWDSSDPTWDSRESIRDSRDSPYDHEGPKTASSSRFTRSCTSSLVKLTDGLIGGRMGDGVGAMGGAAPAGQFALKKVCVGLAYHVSPYRRLTRQ